VLVGRAPEQAGLGARIAAAGSGRGSALVITGEPGIGKSALVADVCGRAEGLRRLAVCGMESESEIGFAVLADLTRGLLDHLGELPPGQAAALSGALGFGSAGALDRLAVYGATLGLLAAASEREPLLISVDDAQWVDSATVEALMFCARRIDADAIVIFLVTRSGTPVVEQATGIEQLELGGLDALAAGELLCASTGASVSPSVAGQLARATAGNPLALLESSALLSAAQLTGTALVEEPLAPGSSIERMFWRRLAALPERCKRALSVAAVSDSGAMRDLLVALRTLGLSVEDLEPAERSGVVVISGERLVFRHPLMRSVAYHAAPAPERRRAHRAMASAVSGPEAPDRCAWHLAAAAVGPDEQTAELLEQAAARMRQRTGYAAAAHAQERAAQLTPGTEQRAGRLLTAAQDAHLAGKAESARERLQEALGATGDECLRSDIERSRGAVEIWGGNVRTAHRLLVEAADRVEPHDPARAAGLLVDATIAYGLAGEVESSIAIAERALSLARGVGGETEMLAEALLGMTLIVDGDAASGCAMMDGALAKAAQLPPSVFTQLAFQSTATVSVWVEEYERAHGLFDGLITALRSAGAVAPLAHLLASRADLDFRTGHWPAAHAGALEALDIGRETGQTSGSGLSCATLARIEAAQGREQQAREHAAEALELTALSGVDLIRTYAAAALGLLELGLGHPDIARGHLASASKFASGHGMAEPGVVHWRVDWVEANIRCGEVAAAKRALAELHAEAERSGRTYALAGAARCRGLLAADGTFGAHFEEAFAWHERTPTPFPRARTELCLGERLRRSGQRRQARVHLTRAAEGFEALGASPWQHLADRELQASGASARRRRHPGSAEELTARELQVAIVIAEGATNREAGASLFLSPKTIEFHLGHIYRKLNIRSRSELTRWMSTN
jgi:DNA-binding CsgD family transcriptional regulator